MPSEYSMSLLSQFSYSYEHLDAFLRMFSQPATCDIILLMEELGETSASNIRKVLKDKQDFVISKSLNLLKNNKKIEKVGKSYRLKTDILFKELTKATKEVKEAIGQKQEEIAGEDIRSVAEIFSDVFFDNVCNIIIHILLERPKNINEISSIYRQNHGYMPQGKVRYYVATKKYSACGKEIRMFELRGGKYKLSNTAKDIHNVFDRFIEAFQTKFEERIKMLWSVPVSKLITERSPIVYLRDPLHKVLRALVSSRALIAFSSEPEGLISAKTAMNVIGGHIKEKGFLENVAAKDVMIPIDKERILKSSTTLGDIFKENKNTLPYNHYIVNTGGNTYGILNLREMIDDYVVI